MMRRIVGVVMMASMLAGSACAPTPEDGDSEPRETAEAAPPRESVTELEAVDEAWADVVPAEDLDATHDSVRTLAEAFLESLRAEDLAGLQELAITPAEFRGLVWPELPSSRPERNLTWSYVWGDLHQKSGNALRFTLRRHGGRDYELMRVEFEDETTNYGTYEVHRDARVVVTDADGEIRRLDLFGSVLERQGRFKIFSFVVD